MEKVNSWKIFLSSGESIAYIHKMAAKVPLLSFDVFFFTRICTISSQKSPAIGAGYFAGTGPAFHSGQPPIVPAKLGHGPRYAALVFPFSPRFPLPTGRSGSFFVFSTCTAPTRRLTPVSESSWPSSWPLQGSYDIWIWWTPSRTYWKTRACPHLWSTGSRSASLERSRPTWPSPRPLSTWPVLASWPTASWIGHWWTWAEYPPEESSGPASSSSVRALLPACHFVAAVPAAAAAAASGSTTATNASLCICRAVALTSYRVCCNVLGADIAVPLDGAIADLACPILPCPAQKPSSSLIGLRPPAFFWSLLIYQARAGTEIFHLALPIVLSRCCAVGTTPSAPYHIAHLVCWYSNRFAPCSVVSQRFFPPHALLSAAHVSFFSSCSFLFFLPLISI